MKRFSISEAARRIGAKPKDLSDLFYHRVLSDRRCPVVGGRRLIPLSYVPTIRAALERAGRRVGKVRHAK